MGVKSFNSEATTRGVLWKKAFLEISLNSQENTCAKVYFLIKLQAKLVYHHLPKKQVKSRNNSVADHLLFCNHSTSYDDFSGLTRKKKLLQ